MVGFDYKTLMDTLGKRIRFARKAAGITQEAVAEELGINRVNITQWESDTTKPELSRIPTLAQMLRTTESWLLDARGAAPDGSTKQPRESRQTVKIIPGNQLLGTGKMPLYAAAMGGDGHVIITFDAVDYIKSPAELENVRGGYGLLIVGESMVPAFRHGDMALVNPHLPPARERNVILYHTPPNGGEVEAMVKQLNSWNDKEWHLEQFKPPLQFKEFRQEWPICHRVIGKYDAR